MILHVCDRCCKQITRFVPSWECKYDLRRSEEGDNASWVRNLDLCEDCQKHIDQLIDDDFNKVYKQKVEVNTGVNWR